MKLPQVYVKEGKEDWVFKLEKALYELKTPLELGILS